MDWENEVWLVSFCRDITERKQVEDGLKYEKNLMQMLFSNIPNLIFVKNIDRRFVKASKSFSNYFGYSLDEIIGKRDEDFLLPHDAAEIAKDELHVMESGEPLINRDEGPFVTKVKEHYFLTTKMPWKNNEGEIIGLFGISMDVTEIKKAEKKIEKLLQEKETLLKEIKHRIKNNINTMTSLLSLQTETLEEPTAIAALEDATKSYEAVSGNCTSTCIAPRRPRKNR